jgi:hypothetical protein
MNKDKFDSKLKFGVPVKDQINRPFWEEDETCPQCCGEGFIVDCCDDLCVGAGRCIHGDGNRTCPTCHGVGDI